MSAAGTAARLCETSEQHIAFTPNPKAAFQFDIAMGILASLLLAAMHYFIFKTASALAFAADVAMLISVFIGLRMRGHPSLSLGSDTLIIADKKRRTVLPWNRISRAVCVLEQHCWEFHLNDQKGPIKYHFYTLSPQQRNEIRTLLLKHIPCWEKRNSLDSARPIPVDTENQLQRP